MSQRSLPLATWQWRDPLTRLFLIIILFTWGYLLEFCGEQPNYFPELQYLMSFGSFIMAIIVGILAQGTLAHMFAYIQGYLLLRKQGIPLHAIMSGEQTPVRVLSSCLVILRQNQNGSKKRRFSKFCQISLYASTLIVYVASVGVGAYAASKLGTPYVFYSAPIKWVQISTFSNEDGRKASFNNAFTPTNFIRALDSIRIKSLAKWVEKTNINSINEVAFLPETWNNVNKAAIDGNLRGRDGWNLEAKFDNINMQYLTAQCKADPNPPCIMNLDRSTVTMMAGRENKTISWNICNLSYGGSVRLDCSITLKGGLLPFVIIAYPRFEPREEHLAEILLRKNELIELNELTDMLFATMEEVLTRPSYRVDIISYEIAHQLVVGWSCDAGNVTCAQIKGASTAVRYVGAILDAAAIVYPIVNNINMIELVENSTSTGSVAATHKVCIGGSNPMLSIGLMIAIPLGMIIIELLPLLYNNKSWWLASDIGFKHIALLRSSAGCEIELPERTIRPGEIRSQAIVRFNAEGDRFRLEQVSW